MTKSTKKKSHADDVPSDIRQRVIKDFGPKLADSVYRRLLEKIPDGLPNGTRPRHLRCILYLARGDEGSLDRHIELCLEDTRDVMLKAEYETDARGKLVHVRNLANSFD